jgi:hypothetical protein
MISNDDKSNKYYESYTAKNIGVKVNRSLAELMYDNYPDLNHKEFVICRTVADTLWDLGGPAPYIEVQARVEELFEDVEEIEVVLKGLIQKGIVRLQTIDTQYGGEKGLRSEKVLRLRDDIETEAIKITGGTQ